MNFNRNKALSPEYDVLIKRNGLGEALWNFDPKYPDILTDIVDYLEDDYGLRPIDPYWRSKIYTKEGVDFMYYDEDDPSENCLVNVRCRDYKKYGFFYYTPDGEARYVVDLKVPK